MIILVPVLIAVVIILSVVGIKGQAQEGGEDVIKKVYTYLVLFATLMMTIGGSIGAFMAIADIVAPSPYYSNFEEFRNMSEKEGIDQKEISEQELRQKYDAIVQAEKDRQVIRAKNNLIKSFGWIVIPLPVFIYFQRRVVKVEAS